MHTTVNPIEPNGLVFPFAAPYSRAGQFSQTKYRTAD